MVMNFDLALNPTSNIIFTVVTFAWSKGLLLLVFSHMERRALKHGSYSHAKYVWNYYTKKEFKEYKETADIAVTYYIYCAFYEATALLAIVIFEAFYVVWEQSQMLATKLRLRNEHLISSLYLLTLRTSFFIAYFPVNLLGMRVTRETLGGRLSWLLWLFVKDMLLISIFSFPVSHLVKYFSRNVIFVVSAAYIVWIMASGAINFNIFTSVEPLEDGPLRKTLEEKVLPEIDFSITDVYHSNDENNEKVYLENKWFQKSLVIYGPLPVTKNVSLIGDTHGSIQFTIEEVIALIVYRIGESSMGYTFSTVLSNIVHTFTVTLVCWHLYAKQYVLHMAGFKRNEPVIANLWVVWYYVGQPYWTFVYSHWRYIYDFTQLTEAQSMVSHFSLQKELISALVKVYKSNKEFPYHHHWYAIFNGYRRPLHTLVRSLSPPQIL